jgi:hypothetical protein
VPLVGFEPTILVFERAKTVHALDRAATVISTKILANCGFPLSEYVENYIYFLSCVLKVYNIYDKVTPWAKIVLRNLMSQK